MTPSGSGVIASTGTIERLVIGSLDGKATPAVQHFHAACVAAASRPTVSFFEDGAS